MIDARQLSGYIFLLGNASLLVLNFYEMDMYHLTSSILLISCSVFLVLSSKAPKWLYVCGVLVISAYLLIAIAAEGEGRWVQISGTILPIIHALLLMRTAWQDGKKQARFIAKTALGKPLQLIDKYPLAGAGLIEAPGTAMICIGAVMSAEWDLAFAAFLWVVGSLTMAWSDPRLPHNIKTDA